MFKEEPIRALHKHLKECVEDEEKSGSPDNEGIDRLLDLQRAIEAIYFNPLLFNDMFEQYDLGGMLLYSLEDLPLHINDHGLLSQVLVKWRLREGV